MGQSKSTRIVVALRRNPGLSKSQLSRELGISAAATGIEVSRLMEAGLIVPAGWNPSNVGRRSQRLRLNTSGPYMLGVELRADGLRFGVVNLAGKVVASDSIQSSNDQNGITPEETVDMISKLRWELEATVGTIAGLGVVVSGIVDAEKQLVRSAPELGWAEVPLVSLLRSRLELPVSLEQNLAAAMLAQDWWGNDTEDDPAALLMLRAEVGVALRVGGSMVTGANGVAGELGHVPFTSDGPVCRCGRRGCFEAYVSQDALRGRYARAAGLDVADVTIAGLIAAARSGDDKARASIDSHARYLGRGIAMLVNIVNPALVVVVDEVMVASSLLLPRIREVVAEYSLPQAVARLEIRGSDLGADSAVLAAATAAFRGLFAGGGIRLAW